MRSIALMYHLPANFILMNWSELQKNPMKRVAITQVLPTTTLPLKVFKTPYHQSYLSEHDQFK